MTARQPFVVQPYVHDVDGGVAPALGGLETDDHGQALRRAARLWERGVYAGVVVTGAGRVVAAFGLIQEGGAAAGRAA